MNVLRCGHHGGIRLLLSHVPNLCFISLLVTRDHECLRRKPQRPGRTVTRTESIRGEAADKVSQFEELMPTILPVGGILLQNLG